MVTRQRVAIKRVCRCANVFDLVLKGMRRGDSKSLSVLREMTTLDVVNRALGQFAAG